jgi:rod shape-determining protein MreD
MTTVDVARTSLVVFVVLVVQHTLLDAVRIDGAHPEAMFLLTAAAGYVGGAERGAMVGFFVGLVADLLVATPFGLSALVGCLVAFATGTATSGLVRGSRWLTVLSLTAGTVAALVGYAVLAAVLGQPGALSVDLAPTLVVATPAAAVLGVPVHGLVRWAVPPPAPSASSAVPGALGR